MSADTTTPTPAESGAPMAPGSAEGAPASLPASDSDLRQALWVTASELIVDIGYTYRGHFITGQQMRDGAKWLVIPRVILPIGASAGAATFALFGLSGLAVVVGFGGAIAVALEKQFDPIGQANAHTNKGDRLLTVWKDLRYFRNVKLRSATSTAELEHELAQIRKRADDLRLLEPRQIPPRAYAEARRQIMDGQSDYVGDPLWQDPPGDL